jgi:hypothetical protein
VPSVVYRFIGRSIRQEQKQAVREYHAINGHSYAKLRLAFTDTYAADNQSRHNPQIYSAWYTSGTETWYLLHVPLSCLRLKYELRIPVLGCTKLVCALAACQSFLGARMQLKRWSRIFRALLRPLFFLTYWELGAPEALVGDWGWLVIISLDVSFDSSRVF